VKRAARKEASGKIFDDKRAVRHRRAARPILPPGAVHGMAAAFFLCGLAAAGRYRPIGMEVATALLAILQTPENR